MFIWFVFKSIEHEKRAAVLKYFCNLALYKTSIRNSVHPQKVEKRLMDACLHLAFPFVTLYLQAVWVSNAYITLLPAIYIRPPGITFLAGDVNVWASGTRMDWNIMFRDSVTLHVFVPHSISMSKAKWKYLRNRHEQLLYHTVVI
jgi:hypothetical protein